MEALLRALESLAIKNGEFSSIVSEVDGALLRDRYNFISSNINSLLMSSLIDLTFLGEDRNENKNLLFKFSSSVS